MELKNYQKIVMSDLKRFLDLLVEKQNIKNAYNILWNEKGVEIGENGMPPYNMSLQGVPHVCLKVPTGGGKTFLAANAVKPIFDAMPHIHPKAVVWLVPSDAIMQQTITNLTNREHPYRQKIDVDFNGKVEVYTKEQLLNGQNFNNVTVDENLSVFILSYDSFRTSNKDGRKAYQQNGNLANFSSLKSEENVLLEDVDDTALIQVIRKLNPVVLVDESHHATSKLSKEMLENFNPCFVLDLTATPKKGSNVISCVDARQLKKEEMVKLPVIVYNLKTQEDVLLTAISLRQKLELKAIKAEKETGKYVRPIVLFQAQPRTSNDSTTYDKIKATLIDIGVPEEEIAIKTADKDEIKSENLMSKDCKIRYIITVNALKEGWDCPFAYILATVANRNSAVDVEQILGRVLRQPYTKASKEHLLNLSYAITSSANFQETLDKVIVGLNNAGFSKKDYRAKDVVDEDIGPIKPEVPEPKQTTFEDITSEQNSTSNAPTEETPLEDDSININTDAIKKQVVAILSNTETEEQSSNSFEANTNEIMKAAEEQNKVYWENLEQESESGKDNIPSEIAEKMKVYHVRDKYKDDIKDLKLPQFVTEGMMNIFSENDLELLDRETLREGFTLRDKDTMIDFDSIQQEIAKVDINDDNELPTVFQMRGFEKESVMEMFDSQPTEKKIIYCKDMIYKRLTKINAISDKEVKAYIDRIISQMSETRLTDLEQHIPLYADKIKKKVEALLKEHELKTFHKWLEQDRIKCEPMYHFPETISPSTTIQTYPKSLYEEEEGNLNDYERKVIYNISNLDNVKWWHRNSSRKGFAINGAIVAYPDLIVMLEDGKILMVETKGDHLDNPESKEKTEAGLEWASLAGRLYRYFMIFETKEPGYKGSYSYDRFMEIVREL